MQFDFATEVVVSASESGRTAGYIRRAKHDERKTWIKHVALPHGADTCLPWPFTRLKKGYGRYRCAEFRTRMAHQAVCLLAHGPAPTPNHEVAHGCGNSSCVNPKHLRWATRKENLADRAAHGTLLKGDRHPNTKHSDATVSALYAKFYAATEQWATELGMTAQTARRILRGAHRK